MNVALRKSMTLAEFLAWEERQELKHEFDGSRAVAMSGGTANHATIQYNISKVLGLRLEGKPCRFFGSDLKFLTAAGTSRHTDGMVVCAPVAGAAQWVDNPVAVFEVLSPSSNRIDRNDKAREHQATPSVQHYVMVEQDAAQATVYRRVGNAWTHEILVAESVVDLSAIGVEFQLSELYVNVDLPSETSEPAA